ATRLPCGSTTSILTPTAEAARATSPAAVMLKLSLAPPEITILNSPSPRGTAKANSSASGIPTASRAEVPDPSDPPRRAKVAGAPCNDQPHHDIAPGHGQRELEHVRHPSRFESGGS